MRHQLIPTRPLSDPQAHFTAASHERRVKMTAPLSKELRAKYGVKRLPIRKDDEVRVVRGTHSKADDAVTGKVVQVYRRKWVIHIERLTREKANGSSVNVGICPSKVVITKVKEDKDRKNLIARRKVRASLWLLERNHFHSRYSVW